MNKEIQLALEQDLGTYLPHPNVWPKSEDLFRGDGVHLSKLASNLFFGKFAARAMVGFERFSEAKVWCLV